MKEGVGGQLIERSNEVNTKTKALGLAWDKDQDFLEFDFDLCKMVAGTSCVTKRTILSTMTAAFDPLGLVSPTSVAAKVRLQDLCLEQSAWDDSLPGNKLKR